MKNELPGNPTLPPGTNLAEASPKEQPTCAFCGEPVGPEDVCNGVEICDLCRDALDWARRM